MLGAPGRGMTAPVLSVRGLSVQLAGERGVRPVLEDVTFDIGAGETVAMVGESGSGKSLTSLAIMRLLPPAARLVAGEILFRGRSGEPLDLARATNEP